MFELQAPLMLYWDLARAGGRALMEKACLDIASSGVFVLNLEETVPAQKSDMAAEIVLDGLRGSGIKIVLTIHAEDTASGRAEGLLAVGGSGLKRLLLRVESLKELESHLADFLELRGKPEKKSHGTSLGVSFAINGKNLREIPEVLGCCLKNGNGLAFEVPIARCMKIPDGQKQKGDEIFMPEAGTLAKLAGEISKMDLGKLEVLIHDPFLWPLFAGKNKNPNAEGCHAAQTMLYIRPDFEVAPCPIMPLSLGNMRTSGIRRIYQSGEKKRLREALAAAPPGCAGCSEMESCRGGCRGRALALGGALAGRDPACPVRQ